VISALKTTLFSGGIVKAASLTPDIAPGGIISIFGAGLEASSVTVNGESASILAALPFQIPFDIPSGTSGVAVTISSVAPEIFTIGSNQAAITNQNNTLNTKANPALRGSTIVPVPSPLPPAHLLPLYLITRRGER